MKDKNDIEKIKLALTAFRKKRGEEYGIKSLGVFGSIARSEAGETSDLDIVVKLEKPDLFALVGIKQEIEESLGINVDIVGYREDMNAFLKKRIDREAVYV